MQADGDCPSLEALEAIPLEQAVGVHAAVCESCALVVDLFGRVREGSPSDDCETFDALLAARADGVLTGAAENLLSRHLASCEGCRAVAETLSPATDAEGDHAKLPRVNPASYAIGLEVARGGMGRILAARDLRVGRPVAVKELLDRSPQLAARFEREARVTARLQHPGILPIYEIGTWPDGTPFYSMRMVDGRTLRDAINAAPTLTARLALLPAVIAAAEAVAFAHSQRVIHRDLTPANVLVGAYGETVVIDWGLAKDLSLGEVGEDSDSDPYRANDVSLTSEGTVIGTPTYMPPEQAHAQPVDERADVYALGAILYQLLAGVAPYDGRNAAAILRAVKAGPPVPLERAPRDLVSIVSKAMAREPDLRYPSARELSEELKRFQTGRLVEAHAYSSRERARRFVARHRGAVTVTALALVVLTVVGTVSVTRVLRSRAAARATAQELLLEKGRVELLGGNPLGALAYLDAAAKRPDNSPALAFLVGAAARAAQSSTLLDCEGYPYGVAISPDGTQLVAACQDHGKVWRLADHALLHTLAGGDDFYGVTYAPTGTTYITWGKAGTARVWDATTGALRATLVHGAEITTSSYSPDGARVLTTGFDGYARLWDTTTGAQILAVEAATGVLRALYGVLSPDGSTILTSTIAGEGKGWDATTGALKGGYTHGSLALGGDVSRDGTLTISCGVDRIARVWDATAPDRPVLTLAGHTDVIWKCLFDASGTHALTTGHDGRANVWDLATGALLVAVEHGDILTAARFAPDGRRFVTVGVDGHVKVWDARSGALLASVDARRGKDARFLPDSRGLVVQRGDGRIEVFADVANQVAAFSPTSDVTLLATSADGTRVIGKRDTGWIAIWDTTTAREIATTSLGSPAVIAARAPVLAASGESSVEVIDLNSGAARASLPFSGTAIALSADGTRLAVAPTQRPDAAQDNAASNAVEIWELAPSLVRRSVIPGAIDAALSSDGRRAMVRTQTGTTFVWDVDAGVKLATLPDGARAVGFAQHDDRVVVLEAVGTAEQHVGVYAEHGALVAREPATAAHIDPSGRWVTVIRPGGIVRTLSVDVGAVHTEFAAEQLVDAQIDATGGLVAAVGDYGKSALVLDAHDGRLLARWPIEHAPPSISQTGFRAPDSAAWWTPERSAIVTQSTGVAVWHAATDNPGPALARVMNRVPWRVADGRLVTQRDRVLRARVVRGDTPIAGGDVAIEIRITPEVGTAEVTWASLRTRYASATARTDEDGRVVLRGLASGAYRVRVTPPGGTPHTFDAFVPVDLADATEQTLDIAK